MTPSGRRVEDVRTDRQDAPRAREIQAREESRRVRAAVREAVQQDAGARGQRGQQGEGGRQPGGFGGARVQGHVGEGGGDEEDARRRVEGLVAACVLGDVAWGGVEPAGKEDEVWRGGGERSGSGGGGRLVDVGCGA